MKSTFDAFLTPGSLLVVVAASFAAIRGGTGPAVLVFCMGEVLVALMPKIFTKLYFACVVFAVAYLIRNHG